MYRIVQNCRLRNFASLELFEIKLNNRRPSTIGRENAFNLVDRSKMMVEVRKHLPDISYWVESIYGVEAVLNLGNSTISSTAGVHQGDPLASLLFSLALLPVVEDIVRAVPSLKQNSWFLDDGALGGNKNDLQQAIDILSQQGPDRGLHLNASKSMVWCPGHDQEDADPLERGIPRVRKEGVKLLGAPVGSQAFEEEVLLDRITKLETLMEKLPTLEDPHTDMRKVAILRDMLAEIFQDCGNFLTAFK